MDSWHRTEPVHRLVLNVRRFARMLVVRHSHRSGLDALPTRLIDGSRFARAARVHLPVRLRLTGGFSRYAASESMLRPTELRAQRERLASDVAEGRGRTLPA